MALTSPVNVDLPGHAASFCQQPERAGLHHDEDGHDDEDDEEIFMGPVTDKEKLKSQKMRRRTEIYRPGFRGALEEGQDSEEDAVAEAGSIDRLGLRGNDAMVTCHQEPDVIQISGSLMSSSPLSSAQSPLSSGERTDSCSEETSIDGSPLVLPAETCQQEDDDVVQTSGSSMSSSSPGSARSLLSSGERTDSCSDDSCLELLSDHNTHSEHGTLSPELMEINTSLAAVDLKTPTLSLVTTSLQAEKESGEAGMDEVELFSATEETCNVRGSDADPFTGAAESRPQSAIESDESDRHGPTTNGCTDQTPMEGTAFASMSSLDANSHHHRTAAIYSSPLLITTNVQAVQYQQPLCYGNSGTNSASRTRVHVIDPGHDYESRKAVTSNGGVSGSFRAVNSAFHNPARFGQVENIHTTSYPPVVRLASSTSPARQSPSTTFRHLCAVSGDRMEVVCASVMSPDVAHKENSDPNIAHSVHSVKLGSGHDGARVFLSPGLPQAWTGQPLAQSPSVARQQRIEDKRAELARLRANKEMLRERIKQDNEKCFNIKMENAAALHNNMAQGMTPLLDRLPSQGCGGMDALALDDHDLDIVTKLHTIRNSQHAPASHVQSPCHHAMSDRVHLHWHQDLVLDVAELSSPSRPRGVARTILTKKSHQAARQVRTCHPASTTTVSTQFERSRARQHLMF